MFLIEAQQGNQWQQIEKAHNFGTAQDVSIREAHKRGVSVRFFDPRYPDTFIAAPHGE